MNDIILNKLKDYTLLFVENEKGIRENFSEFFNLLFKKTYIACDGAEALELYNINKPDLIITDIKMPNMDGIELVKNIRQSDNKTSIVIISAHTDLEFLLSSIELNLIKYIIKPLNEEKLFEIFEIFLKQIQEDLKEYNFTLDSNKNQIIVDDNIFELSLKEKLFIEKLIQKDSIISYEEIESDIWDGKFMSQNALRLFIKNLRKKLPNNFIKNMPNQGYIVNTQEN
ncbi:MAG: response regulator [Arcobacteraceae bacterium]|nr:response regulator [Arcobacteraceae bacterium]